jgi:hypothetical protein
MANPQNAPGPQRVQIICANPACRKSFYIHQCEATRRKTCSRGCSNRLLSIINKGKPKNREKKLLSRQTHRGTRSRSGDDARLKKQEPDKLPTKPVDTVTPWYRDPSAPGNKLVQTKNPKPGYIPLNRNNYEGTDSM